MQLQGMVEGGTGDSVMTFGERLRALRIERRLNQRELAAAQWTDARRLYEAFVNRYPQDARAAKAQFSMGEAYMGEKRYANAIGAYTKVIDNFPKAEIVPDAMYKNGLAFYALKYCSDARVYFQELLKRYPKTGWKKDAGFHHSFTTSKPRESGRHGEKSGASQPGAPGTSEHDKP